MSIFNSLGSNYSGRSVWQALFAGNDDIKQEVVTDFLNEKYQGKSVLLYKGREALRLALRAINKSKEYTVGICGYTCYAVYDAVIQEGYDVVYLDISKDTLNFSKDTLVEAKKKHPKLHIIIIQNTLGYPCEIAEIASYCKKEKIILIEDLAHSVGTLYNNNQEAGTRGDFVAMSFSQDKVVDAVSGGALIIRDAHYTLDNMTLQKVGWKRQSIDRLYPFFTYIIRNTYDMGFGKMLHYLLKRFSLLANPMKDEGKLFLLPSWYCHLVYQSLLTLQGDIFHRKKIAHIYADNLDKKILSEAICKNINVSTNIRFPIFVEHKERLISYLKRRGIFVSDIWYDAPIAPKKYLSKTSYKHQCPVSERISQAMVNLPTHKNISETKAQWIANIVNEWLKTQ